MNQEQDENSIKSTYEEKCFWVSYIAPLLFIIKNNEQPINFTLEEINSCSYDHSKLCRIIGEIEDKYNKKLYKYYVCGDGAFALKHDKKIDIGEIILSYNNLFCKLLLGGIPVESVNNQDIVTGSLYKDKSIWPVNFGQSASSQMHSRLRMLLANNIETILLLGTESKTIGDIKKAYQIGNSILNKLKNISSYFLISGITALKYCNWSSALSHLSIVSEQLIEYIWEEKFLNNNGKHPTPDFPNRKKTLKQDQRTFSSSVKHEILFQIKAINSEIYSKLYSARKARNKLVHEGVMINKDDAISLFEAIKMLINTNVTLNVPLCNHELRYLEMY